MTVNRLQREARRAAGQSRRNESRPSGRKAGWTPPVAHRKKFDRDIGEYVEYEEVTTISTTSSQNKDGNDGYTGAESQIVDAEWEDIK